MDGTFSPVLASLQRTYPRMDEVVRMAGGHFEYADIETLDRVVKGSELFECYWDAVQLFYDFMRLVFERILADEIGQSRVGRQFQDLWAAFLHELDEDIARIAHRRAAAHVQGGRARDGHAPGGFGSGPASPYGNGMNPQRRFN